MQNLTKISVPRRFPPMFSYTSSPIITAIIDKVVGQCQRSMVRKRQPHGEGDSPPCLLQFYIVFGPKSSMHGLYTCFRVSSVFPKFVKTPIDVTVKAGNTARLQCAATGQPTPIIKWNKDKDFPAARERRVHVMPEDDVFFIVEVERQDEGVYTCIAKNDAGMISANATLRVLGTSQHF